MNILSENKCLSALLLYIQCVTHVNENSCTSVYWFYLNPILKLLEKVISKMREGTEIKRNI